MRIRHDPQRIGQVVANLVGNAVKFTPRDGSVTIDLEPSAEGARIIVADTGVGIDPAELPHIFERYWYGDRRGTGLGLFIAQSIVRAHGDGLRVRSEEGAGTTFSFSLRRSTSKSAIEAPSGERAAPPFHDEKNGGFKFHSR